MRKCINFDWKETRLVDLKPAQKRAINLEVWIVDQNFVSYFNFISEASEREFSIYIWICVNFYSWNLLKRFWIKSWFFPCQLKHHFLPRILKSNTKSIGLKSNSITITSKTIILFYRFQMSILRIWKKDLIICKQQLLNKKKETRRRRYIIAT